MKTTLSFVVLLLVVTDYVYSQECGATATKVSGSSAPTGQICAGQLLLDEQFNSFNTDLWKHEVTLGGGGVSISLKIL